MDIGAPSNKNESPISCHLEADYPFVDQWLCTKNSECIFNSRKEPVISLLISGLFDFLAKSYRLWLLTTCVCYSVLSPSHPGTSLIPVLLPCHPKAWSTSGN